jgi:S-adenosylmethionine decarboxylase
MTAPRIPLHATHGMHLIADLHGVRSAALSDLNALEALLREAATAAGAHVLSAHFHRFGTEAGITGVLLLAESHISIHTWPEHAYAAVDIFMCGHVVPERALHLIEQGLGTESVVRRNILRGGGFAAQV